MRPRHCVLPGSSGTHSVCVCTIHQNSKLMLDAIDIQELTKDWEKQISGYKDCLELIMCSNQSNKCNLGECTKSPDLQSFSLKMIKLLEDTSITDVEYSSWTTADRATLQTIKVDAESFVEELYKKLKALRPHSFIAKQQSLFITEKQQNLSDGEVVVMFDFSENYAYKVQDASQPCHVLDYLKDKCSFCV